MLTRIDSPAGVEPSVQMTLRAYQSPRDDLARMPGFKSGTPWEADRLREQARLVGDLARLGLHLN